MRGMYLGRGCLVVGAGRVTFRTRAGRDCLAATGMGRRKVVCGMGAGRSKFGPSSARRNSWEKRETAPPSISTHRLASHVSRRRKAEPGRHGVARHQAPADPDTRAGATFQGERTPGADVHVLWLLDVEFPYEPRVLLDVRDWHGKRDDVSVRVVECGEAEEAK